MYSRRSTMELLTIDQIISLTQEETQGLDPEIREGIVLNKTDLPVSELDRLKSQLQIQDLDPIFKKYILAYNWGQIGFLSYQFGYGDGTSLTWLINRNLYWTKIKKHLIIVVMKLTNEETQKIEQLLKDSSYAKYHKRLQIIYFRSKEKSYKEIMDLLDYNKTTVWRNLKKYKEFGLEALLQETRGGRHREYMTYEEEQAFLKRHIEAAQAGEFVTVNQLFEAYQKEIGRTSTRDGFYYLLKRHGWRTVTPRPEHPKKADAQTIETSKNKIYIRDFK